MSGIQAKRALILVCVLVSAVLLAVELAVGARGWGYIAPMVAVVTGTLALRSTRGRS